jgi:hypothetical protein
MKLNVIRQLLLALILAVVFIVPSKIHAQDVDPANPTGKVCQAAGATGAACETKSDDPITGSNGVLKKAITLVTMAVGVISVIMIILGGYSYVMSNGDPQRIASARNTILYAVIGLVVAASAQFIVGFVLSKL